MSVKDSSLLGSREQRQCQTRPPSPHILLGITGSVAAVKGPELALTLVQQHNASVIVLLTRGGMNFWGRSSELYNPVIWKDFLAHLVENNDGNGIQSFMSKDDGRGEENIEGKTKKLTNNNGGVCLLSKQIGTEEENRGGRIMIVNADDEWKDWTKIGDPVLHIQLRDWADILVVAPLSAHTLGKISNGLCDDTLTCVVRAWDFGNVDRIPDTFEGVTEQRREAKPLVIAPAMNTAMWTHPLTDIQLNIIKGFWTGDEEERIRLNACRKGKNNVTKKMDVDSATPHLTGNVKKVNIISVCPVKIVSPQVKMLACGEIGSGAMANVHDIVAVVQSCYKLN